MTTQGNLWPIKSEGKFIEWKAYKETQLSDIAISPLQKNFQFNSFAQSLLANTTGWDNLTNPSHDPLARGALGIIDSNNKIQVLEGEPLKHFMQHGNQNFKPIFFCDKELGKIKPLDSTSLSDIYKGIDLINEFKGTGIAVVVATCSPEDTKDNKSIIVQTQLPAQKVEEILPALAVKKIKEVTPVSVSSTKMEVIKKSQEISAMIDSVKVLPRVKGYQPGNTEHNAKQPLESIQFEFTNSKDKELFNKIIKELDTNAIVYSGKGLTGMTWFN